MSATSFVETEALIAVMDDDEQEALRILRTMLPGELVRFAGHADHLHGLVRRVWRENQAP